MTYRADSNCERSALSVCFLCFAYSGEGVAVEGLLGASSTGGFCTGCCKVDIDLSRTTVSPVTSGGCIPKPYMARSDANCSDGVRPWSVLLSEGVFRWNMVPMLVLRVCRDAEGVSCEGADKVSNGQKSAALVICQSNSPSRPFRGLAGACSFLFDNIGEARGEEVGDILKFFNEGTASADSAAKGPNSFIAFPFDRNNLGILLLFLRLFAGVTGTARLFPRLLLSVHCSISPIPDWINFPSSGRLSDPFSSVSLALSSFILSDFFSLT